MKKLSLIIALFAFATLSFAQTTISGKLLDEKKTPLGFANVILQNSKDSSLVRAAMSEDNGKFIFENIAVGKYFVAVTFVGYKKFTSPNIDVKDSDKSLELTDIQLFMPSNELKEVSIVAKKPLLEMKGDKIVMNIESSPIASQGTALEALRRAPGVMVRQEKELALRGKSGVLVMIDDKITQMSQEDLIRYLQSIPATMIDKIEIINNPSARYDAAGTSGIINIKLKKDQNIGLNGTTTVVARYGRTPKGSLSTNLNYRNKKVNVFGNISANHWEQDNRQYFQRDIYSGTNMTTFDQAFIQAQNENSLNSKVGVDFFLGKNTTFGLMSTASNNKENNDFDNKIDVFGYNSDVFTQLVATGVSPKSANRYSFNSNLKHTFDTLGREITIDADYSTYMKTETQTVENKYFNSAKNEVKLPFTLKNQNRTDLDVFATKIDYVHPMKNKSTLELGWKSSWVGIGNSIFFEKKLSDGSWTPEKNRNNDFDYKENINAAYVNYNFPLGKKLNIQSGLRMENTINTGHSVTLDSTLSFNYTNFFPTANINYQIDEKNMLSASYSLRVNRPGYQELNPFVYYIDEFTSGKGNPFLRPEFTNAILLNHTFMQTVSTSVYYAKTKNSIMQILAQEPNSRNAYQTNANLADFDNFSFTIASPIPIKKWWNGNVSVTGFWNSYRSNYLGNDIKNEQWSWNGYIENNFTLGKGFSAEVSAWGNTPLVWGVFKMKAQGSVDLGISKKFKNGSKLKFAVSDIFKTSNNRINVNDNGLVFRMHNNGEPRQARVSYSMKFGNQNVKAARERQTATSEEMGRVKGK
jgi:hypothetical protein